MSIVQSAIQEELKEKIEKSKIYASKIKEAKTTIKKKIYKKRLRKNNEDVFDLLVALDKLNKK